MIRKIFRKYKGMIKYFAYSCLSTIIDVVIVRVLFGVCAMELVLANTIGVVCGFVVSYLLSAKSVFGVNVGVASFAVFFGTFILGLFMANWLIESTFLLANGPLSETLAFWLSKGVSVVVPFFIMYYIRKFLYAKLREREEK